MFNPPLANDTPAIKMPYSETTHEDTSDFAQLSIANRPNIIFFHTTGEDILSQWWSSGVVTGAETYDSTPVPRKTDVGKRASNSLRLNLLAKKYAGRTFSNEDEARLTILTERIRRAVARVDEEDVAILEEAALEIEQSRALRARLTEKYGK
jgi:hypothetical protein